jgi:hypothetical protein
MECSGLALDHAIDFVEFRKLKGSSCTPRVKKSFASRPETNKAGARQTIKVKITSSIKNEHRESNCADPNRITRHGEDKFFLISAQTIALQRVPRLQDSRHFE